MQGLALPPVPPVQQAALLEQPEEATLRQAPVTQPDFEDLCQNQPSLQAGLHRAWFDQKTSWRGDMFLEGKFQQRATLGSRPIDNSVAETWPTPNQYLIQINSSQCLPDRSRINESRSLW